jgi:hypothetical protein
MHSSPSVIRGSGQLANLRPVSLHEAQPSRASRAQIACATSGQGRCQEHSADPAWLGPAARPPANRWMRALVDVGGHERPRPSRLAAAYTSQPSPPTHRSPRGAQPGHSRPRHPWLGRSRQGWARGRGRCTSAPAPHAQRAACQPAGLAARALAAKGVRFGQGTLVRERVSEPGSDMQLKSLWELAGRQRPPPPFGRWAASSPCCLARTACCMPHSPSSAHGA